MPLRVTDEDIDTEYQRKIAKARRRSNRIREEREAKKPKRDRAQPTTGIGHNVNTCLLYTSPSPRD